MHNKITLLEEKSTFILSLLLLMAGFLYCYVRGLSFINSVFLILELVLSLSLMYLTRSISLKALFKLDNTFLMPQSAIKKLIKHKNYLERLKAHAHHTFLYLGRGFVITPKHTSALYSLMAAGLSQRSSLHNGSPEIHRIDRAHHLFMNIKNLEGHTLMFGAPGSGKTRFFELLIMQAIMRNESVIIIDPKGDHDLKESVHTICTDMERSLRIIDNRILKNNTAPFNLLANIGSPQEAADRLKALLEDKDSVFSDYAYQALIATAISIKILHRHYTFENFKHYFNLRSFREAFLTQCVNLCLKTRDPKVITYLGRVLQAQKVSLKDYPRLEEELNLIGSGNTDSETRDSAVKKEESLANPKKLTIALGFVLDYLVKNHPSALDSVRDIETLRAVLDYDEEFFKKTTSSITPKLETLANTYLNEFFSPKSPDAQNLNYVIEENEVLYVALNSLSDNTLSRLMGSMLLKELESIAADFYALNMKASHPVSVFIDEAYETVGNALIQLLNKGRGAGFNLTLATQTLGDFEVNSSKDYRALVLGNCNNLISMRIRDEETAHAVTSGLPATSIVQQSVNVNIKGHSFKDYEDTLGYGERSEEVPLFPKTLLGSLPNFEYLARLNDGRLIKGVIPLINYDHKKMRS
jgi:conjugative coupling factor TraD (SXT/TOL subfamily)